MLIFKLTKDIKAYINECKKEGKRIGFVPTMGALHKGHISLINKCNDMADMTICSIFVNPTQFNNPDDLKKYPVTIENDITFLESNNCDVLFLPELNEIYPEGPVQNFHFDLRYLEAILEGEYRPGHFQGVCQVVKLLLDIVEPHQLYLGQKDYQQCMVIKRLIELMSSSVELIICPTVREDDGLAMSSRNLRLNGEERRKAIEIFKTLMLIKDNIKNGNIEELKAKATDHLAAKGFKVDYVEIADGGNLHPISDWDGKTSLVALAAAYLNDVRLIDNVLL
jgi:pantoate--beta-alanine ligase